MGQADGKVRAIERATEYILDGVQAKAASAIREGYPFTPIRKENRSYTARQMTEQFFRDGFVDRYFGTRIVNPGMLRVLSERLPEDFPYQTHWSTDRCHLVYWELQPTIDHIVPIALGGPDDPSNWATTSMRDSLAKSTSPWSSSAGRSIPRGTYSSGAGCPPLSSAASRMTPPSSRSQASRVVRADEKAAGGLSCRCTRDWRR